MELQNVWLGEGEGLLAGLEFIGLRGEGVLNRGRGEQPDRESSNQRHT